MSRNLNAKNDVALQQKPQKPALDWTNLEEPNAQTRLDLS